MEQRLHFLTLATPDLDAAHRFYRDGRKTTPIYAFNQTSLFLQPLSVISTPKS